MFKGVPGTPAGRWRRRVVAFLTLLGGLAALLLPATEAHASAPRRVETGCGVAVAFPALTFGAKPRTLPRHGRIASGPAPAGRAPEFNEHGDAILTEELGMDMEAVIDLKIKNVIA